MNGRGERWWSAVVVAVVVALLFAWFAGRRPANRHAARGAAVPLQIAAGAPAAPSAQVASPALTATPAATAHGTEEQQICGGAWVRVGADGSIDGDGPGSAAEVAALRERATARLGSSQDEYARSVATWLEGGDEAPLVTRALGTHDPRVYALAYATCRRAAAGGGPCALLSAAQWARLDPDNAAPWLYTLAEAASRRDAGGVDEALYQIGRAPRSTAHAFAPALPILDAAQNADASTIATLGLATQAIGLITAAVPPVASARAACQGALLADANRRQLCERVAETLAERSDDLVSRAIGTRIASDLSGSSERYQLHRAELQAWSDAGMEGTDATEALGCRFIRRTLDRLREQALVGEVGAVRRWIAQSGLTPNALLARARAAEGRQAASAAPAVRRAEADAASAPAPASAP